MWGGGAKPHGLYKPQFKERGDFIYEFVFHYDEDANSVVKLPLAPEGIKTNEKSLNKTVELMAGGEVSILKGLALRDIEFKFLLPKDNTLTHIPEDEFKEPIFYLAKFREFIQNKKPFRLSIIRNQQNGTAIFEGNILVSIEEYKVSENAGEEGDFWIEMKLKEI